MKINPLDRRTFLTGAAAAGAASALPVPSLAAKAKAPTAETLVQSLYKTLNDDQRAAICFPFDHDLRLKVDNNWHITKTRLAKSFSADQQAMVKEIFLGLHSEEYAKSVLAQVESDGGGHGFDDCSIALFGKPDTGKFEFVLTGRHCTRRCDGDSVEGTAFGGPIFYGHAAGGFNEGPEHKGNAYWFQAKRANELFAALDGKQRETGLISDRPRGERGTRDAILANKFTDPQGIGIGDLSADQKDLATQVMTDLLAPFREKDRDESMKLLNKQGLDNLHFAWFKHNDIGEDKVWDVWKVEGPSMLWFFRGAPHVHAWVHIKDPS